MVEGEPKTDAGTRHVPLDKATVATLRAWRARQNKELLAWGSDWQDKGLVFTREDGSPRHPDAVTETLERLALAAHLPPVNLHGIRHANIGQLLAAGYDVRLVQERVGHSGSKMTRDCAAVTEQVARDMAEAATAMIPRKNRKAQGGPA